MGITWELAEGMPARLVEKFATLVQGELESAISLARTDRSCRPRVRTFATSSAGGPNTRHGGSSKRPA
jgi:hypothetical protein